MKSFVELQQMNDDEFRSWNRWQIVEPLALMLGVVVYMVACYMVFYRG